MEQLRIMMNEAVSKLPEYPVVMAMKGVGKSLGPQLTAEIGDVSRFTHKGAITALFFFGECMLYYGILLLTSLLLFTEIFHKHSW